MQGVGYYAYPKTFSTSKEAMEWIWKRFPGVAIQVNEVGTAGRLRLEWKDEDEEPHHMLLSSSNQEFWMISGLS